MKSIIKELPIDKINISFNKKPIKMELFLGFLTVDVKRSNNHLGPDNCWTRLYGDGDLIIGGGKIMTGKWPDNKYIEYLDTIQYGKKLRSPYNNYVNPFYLADIMTKSGVDFFLKYYSDEIKAQIKNANNELAKAKARVDDISKYYNSIGLCDTV